MGCGQSAESKQMQKRHRQLTNQMKKKTSKKNSEFVIMLMGSGESGKSTVLKQMKVIYGNGFSESECLLHVPIIKENIFVSLYAVLDAMQYLGIPLEDESLEDLATKIKGLSMTYDDLTDHWDSIKSMVENENFKKVLDRSHEYQLNDSAKFYFTNLDRISQEGYLPTTEDIMKSRAKTTAVIRSTFKVDDLTINMIDIGGQRCERKKWLSFFDHMTAMIFVVALSEYNLMMEEDSTMNRSYDTLSVFKSVASSLDQPIIVFLNKYDLFAEKLKKFPLKDCWPEYEGGDDVEKAVEFIKEKFKQQLVTDKREVYFKETTATDTDNLRFIFKFVLEQLTEANMLECGFA